MNLAPLVLLIGLFGIPGLLMVLGHRLRGRTTAHKRRFWGGVYGYILGMLLAVASMLIPPVAWTDEPGLRSALVHWAMLVGGLLGVLTGPMWAGPPRPRR